MAKRTSTIRATLKDAKKILSKNKKARTSTIDQTIAASATGLKTKKKATKTRTMAETLKAASAAPKVKKLSKKQVAKKGKKVIKAKKGKKSKWFWHLYYLKFLFSKNTTF